MQTPLFVRPLTADERATLETGLRSSSACTVRRCQMLLASAEGQSTTTIAHDLRCTDHTVRKCTLDGKILMTLGTSGKPSDTGYTANVPNNLTTITPSVVPQGNTTGTVVGKNPFDFANYQIGGAFANEAAEYLDGQPLNIGYINLPVLIPTQDSIQEFKVQTSNLGPEWGKFSGGVTNCLKSGSSLRNSKSASRAARNRFSGRRWIACFK